MKVHGTIYLRWHSYWRHLDSLYRADESQHLKTKQLSTVTVLLCRFFSRSCFAKSTSLTLVSALLSCLYVSSLFWLITSLQILRNLAALLLPWWSLMQYCDGTCLVQSTGESEQSLFQCPSTGTKSERTLRQLCQAKFPKDLAKVLTVQFLCYP